MDTIKTIPALNSNEQRLAQDDLIGAIRAYHKRVGCTLQQARRAVEAFRAFGVSFPIAINLTITEG